MPEVKNVEQIEKEIEQAKSDWEEIEGEYENLHIVKFEIENCDIEAMREIATDEELNFWEHCNKMTYSYPGYKPSIRLYSPEIEVEEHKVKSYAYKNV